MSKTFDQGREEIAKLCEYFAINQRSFLATGVKEAHVRQMLVDPFFEALGWDVRNENRTAPQYREVIPEESLDVEGRAKAPDYTFRVGTLPKFFAEAKRCGENISGNANHANQLRVYGWSAKAPLSILTDFEVLAVYDCTLRPRPGDKASHARINFFRYDEFHDRWRELWEVFSREAVWSGSFDQYAASKRKRGTSEVDTEFLKEIEAWREALARNIALRNDELSSGDLNAAVQRTIDRVVFLRMAEDRGLEPYEQLLKLCAQPEVYSRFMRQVCRRADEKYNSGLFYFERETGVSDAPDRISPRLVVDDKVFRPIIHSLYFAHGSPYHFGVMPVEILGTVYERFLGKVIRLTAGHQAKVEEKPEVRKAGGVYYTPAHIVQYIVQQTVGSRMEGQSPRQLAGLRNGRQPLRVLDMACGSGSFLLGAYQHLLDYYLKWYLDHNPKKHPKAVYNGVRTGQWRLSIEEKKRILLTHIFGVDLDAQAVEVTKLSLLLKVLEGETEQSVVRQLQLFQQRALPNLADNIKCGNSLIGADYFMDKNQSDAEELSRVKPFDWNVGFSAAMRDGGFDCVIGNPPYLFITEVLERDRAYYQQHFPSVSYRFDLYGVFVEQAMTRLVQPRGRLGFIIPHTLLSNDSFQTLRSYLAQKCRIPQIVNIGPGVFQDAKNETMLLFCENFAPDRACQTEIVRTTAREFRTRADKTVVRQLKWAPVDGQAWLLKMSNDNLAVLSRLLKQPHTLGDFCTANQGLRTGDNLKYLSHRQRGKAWKSAAGGKEIGRYAPIPRKLFVCYDPQLLDAPRRPEIFMSPEKIVVQEIRNISLPQRIIATLDRGQTYCLQSTNVVNLRPEARIDLRFLLGVLNSRVVNYFFRCKFPGNNHIPSNQLLKIPIPYPESTASVERLNQLVEQMLGLYRDLALTSDDSRAEVLKRQIDATDQEIDRFVNRLYGLTAKETTAVEKADY